MNSPTEDIHLAWQTCVISSYWSYESNILLMAQRKGNLLYFHYPQFPSHFCYYLQTHLVQKQNN